MIAVPRHCDVVVLGAGPAGLATAWYAVRRGLTAIVLDRAAAVGGLAGSLIVDGQSVDLGSHRLHPSIRPDIRRDLGALAGLELQWRPRAGRIRLGGRWLDFPLSPTDLLRHAPPSFAAGVLGDMVRGSVRRGIDRVGRRPGGAELPAADSFAGQVRTRLGPTIARSFYEPYARKLWAVDGQDLSAELFDRRVGVRSAGGILRRALRRGPAPGFWYPAGGFGTIGTAMAAAVERGGGTIVTSTQVASISSGPDHQLVRLRDGQVIGARTVVSTIPSAGLLDLIDAPAHVRAAAAELTFRGAVLVYLTVPRDRYTRFDAHYFPEPATCVSRLSEPKNYRTSSADPTGRTVLCAELPSTPGDDVWLSDDDALIRRVGRELAEHGLPEPVPIGGRVVRRTHVYPVYRRGFENRRRVVEDFDPGRDIAVLGRQALFAHDNTHHALLMAKSVVECLSADARIDRDRWSAVRRSFADHVVED